MALYTKFHQRNTLYRQTQEEGKKKNHLISQDAQKAFDKIQHFFMSKVLERTRIYGTHLKIIKAIYNQPTTNVKLIGEKLEVIP